jgi:hypothetical protein
MKWWKFNKPEVKPVEVKFTVTAPPGTIIAVDGDPSKYTMIPEKPKDPEPDLSTMPKDRVSYSFGFVCPKKHVLNLFDSITIDGYSERRVCATCGGVSKPCVVKKIWKPKWSLGRPEQSYFYIHPAPATWGWWGGTSDFKFFHYLENPKRGKK